MNRGKIIFGYLFGFLLSLIIVLMVFLLVFKLTVGNKNYVLNILEKNDYYQKIDDEIKEEMGLYILSSGFTEEIYDNVYEHDNLVKDIKNYVDGVYLGQVVEVDTTSIKEKIEENITVFFKKNNATFNKSDVALFIDGLVNVYNDEVSLYHFTDSIIPKIPKITKIVDIGLIALSVLLVILLIVLYKIKYKYFYGTIMSSGLIILFLRLFVFERIDVDSILIITENFSEELRIILHALENLTLILGISLIIIGMILLIISFLSSKKNKS